jgi:hypothetical protein
MSYDNLSSVSQNVLKFYQQLTGEERRIPFIFYDFHFCHSRVIGLDKDLSTDGQTDKRTDRHGETSIPLYNFVAGGIIINFLPYFPSDFSFRTQYRMLKVASKPAAYR